MILRHKKEALASAVVLSILSGQSALAAGFEKSILWSGKYAGQGGAAVSSASGAEALYFNPAGLAGSANEVSINVSPTVSKLSGPLVSNDTTLNSTTTVSPLFGAMANYGINESLTIGVGAYVAGGAKSLYENQTVGAVASTELGSELSAMEASVGIGYKIMPGLSVGAAWRATQVNADFKGAEATIGSTLSVYNLKDLKATSFSGFRAGVQYVADDNSWGLGASYRSAVDFTAEGSLSAKSILDGSDASTSSTSSVSTSLPAQLAVGGHYAINSEWTTALEYVWTNYAQIETVAVSGTVGATKISDLSFNWKNQSNVRAGFRYAPSSDWTYRAGYVYTSQVTNAKYASATLTPPGAGHTITAGFGTNLGSNLELNIAGEYSMTSGAGEAGGDANTGDYTLTGYMLHTGLNYRF